VRRGARGREGREARSERGPRERAPSLPAARSVPATRLAARVPPPLLEASLALRAAPSPLSLRGGGRRGAMLRGAAATRSHQARTFPTLPRPAPSRSTRIRVKSVSSPSRSARSQSRCTRGGSSLRRRAGRGGCRGRGPPRALPGRRRRRPPRRSGRAPGDHAEWTPGGSRVLRGHSNLPPTVPTVAVARDLAPSVWQPPREGVHASVRCSWESRRAPPRGVDSHHARPGE